jgi:hypothetical protein
MGLVVHAVHALDHSLLHLLDDLAALAGVRVDPVYPLVVHLHFEVLGPAAIAAKPAPYLAGALHHDDSIGPSPWEAVPSRKLASERNSALLAIGVTVLASLL